MATNVTISNTIVLCWKCNGCGYLERNELIDYHRDEYNCWNELCTQCKGSGRMHQIIKTETTIEPFINDVADKLQVELIHSKIKKK